ncbi:hypothetical protein KIPB_009637, partial [Kipferlia bialata]|eukprot:g9637.t1
MSVRDCLRHARVVTGSGFTRCASNYVAEVRSLADVLGPHIVPIVTDLNGNHCIQGCLEAFPQDRCDFIFSAVAKQCVRVATHQHGCCVYQRCLDAASDAQRHPMIVAVQESAGVLVEDKYGNYVVQYVMKLGTTDSAASDRMIERIMPLMVPLSRQ